MTKHPDNSTSFYGLGIAPDILKRLDFLNFKIPTPIQEKSILSGINGEDLIGIAQTGTGKTLAFAIPMLQQIMANGGQGLIILPTRELAIQVEEAMSKLGNPFGLRTAVLIGGASMERQRQDIRRGPHVIIATPGRLNDHIQQKTISLKEVRILVLDEADRMLDMGFEPQIKRILSSVPEQRQTMLFSATMPERISQIANKYMRKPLRVEVAPSGTTAEKVEQEVFIVRKEDKIKLLQQLLLEYKGTVLIFSRTKHGAKKINRILGKLGHRAAEIHSDRSLSQRREALSGFKTGKYRVLVATDIAARGIDVVGIELVVNFDLPDQAEDYIHRIGRTGRAGLKGKAVSFAAPEEKHDIHLIENLIKIRLPVKPLPELSGIEVPVMMSMSERPTGRRFPDGGRRHENGSQKRKRRRQSRF
ncbi:MAG: DEAD/DEAH box helicase [Patescibacteria group bacterium]